MPEEFNIPSIQARLSALETAIFKLEGINNLKNLDKETILNYIKEVLVAHSNLIQILLHLRCAIYNPSCLHLHHIY